MGADLTALSDAHLIAAALKDYDNLMIGIFALRFCPALAPLMPAIRHGMTNGDTLLTLYHRPWDNWDSAQTALAPPEIGKPSLRGRVTQHGSLLSGLFGTGQHHHGPLILHLQLDALVQGAFRLLAILTAPRAKPQ